MITGTNGNHNGAADGELLSLAELLRSGLPADIARSARRVPQEDEYLDGEGYLCCARCGTRKEVEVEIVGRPVRYAMRCRCEREAADAAYREAHARAAAKAAAERRAACFGSARLENCTFANAGQTDGCARRAAEVFVETFDEQRAAGRGLLFYGPTGTGKTYMAACIANALLERGRSCRMTGIGAIERDLFNLNDKKHYLDRLMAYDLLVLDDFGAERQTEYMQGIAFDVIDGRIAAGMPLVVTTNLTNEELWCEKEVRGERVPDRSVNPQRRRMLSRLTGACAIIRMGGEDRRVRRGDAVQKHFWGMMGGER